MAAWAGCLRRCTALRADSPKSNGAGRCAQSRAPRPAPLHHRANQAQITNRLNPPTCENWGAGHGVSVAQAARDLDLHPNLLRNWVKAIAADPVHAFPGQGRMKPEQLEIERLRREVTKLKAERDILKKAAAYFAKEST